MNDIHTSTECCVLPTHRDSNLICREPPFNPGLSYFDSIKTCINLYRTRSGRRRAYSGLLFFVSAKVEALFIFATISPGSSENWIHEMEEQRLTAHSSNTSPHPLPNHKSYNKSSLNCGMRTSTRISKQIMPGILSNFLFSGGSPKWTSVRRTKGGGRARVPREQC
jgi:hypothetical protein